LILDGISYHKYGEIREFLSSVNRDKEPKDWSITCILFAPNSPQQNPVEAEVLKDSLTPEKWGQNVVLCTQS
jgi:hypothetical protein